MPAFFDIPRNLPHAATIAKRIGRRLSAAGFESNPDAEELVEIVLKLVDLLVEFEGGEDPPDDVAAPVAEQAAALARRAVDEIERLGLGEDRLGQAVRNLFECLGLGKEGAEISLRAGENPASLTRPA